MVAIIGGETHRFRPLIDLYKQAGKQAGHPAEKLRVGLHSLGYVAASKDHAVNDYYPGYAEAFTKIGKERGWPPVTRERFDSSDIWSSANILSIVIFMLPCETAFIKS